ncbi:hypothetical protein Tco_0377808 [Tanacetum coccineum]
MLVKAQESGQVLDEEQLGFSADPGVVVGQDTQTTMPINAAFQTDDVDAFDLDCDEAPGAQVVLMANLSSYDLDVISEVPNSENYQNNVVSDMCVQEESYYEQLTFNLNPDIDITSDSNIISYDQYLQETESAHVQNNTSFDQQNAMIMLVFDAISDQVAKCTADNLKHKELDASLTAELESYKEQELFAEQAFWLRISNPIYEQPVVQTTPVKMEAPCELPKELFNDFDNGLNLEFNKVKTVFNQMEVAVKQCSVDKKYFEIEKKELSLDNDRLLEHIICQDVMNVVMHANVHSHNVLPTNNNHLEHANSASELLKYENDHLMELLISQDLVHSVVNSLVAINDYKNMQKIFVDEYNETIVLKAEVANKHDMIENVVYNKLSKRCSRLENRFEQARALKPLDNALDYALSSSTEASGSKPSSNTKKDRITQNSSSNKKKIKVEDHPMIVKSSLNNMNCVSKPVCNENVKHSVLNVNSKLICATYHECKFDVIHDLCVRDYLNDVNARVRSKSLKSRSSKSRKKIMWKPTSKVYTNVGYS